MPAQPALDRPSSDRLVFVSHHSLDTWVARQLAREIEAAGARAFLDEAQVEVGADFEDEIRRFLEAADELVVPFTPWALTRPYVWTEIGAAWVRKIPIVSLLHGITPPEIQARQEIPLLVKKRDMIALNEVETYLKELRNRVAGDARQREAES